MSKPAWLPPLMKLEDYGGNWQKYEDAVFAEFYRDFVESQPQLRDMRVACRKEPLSKGKEEGFWHCVTERFESERVPDLRRCERVPRIRSIIEHADDPNVDTWTDRVKGDVRHFLWLNEEYLIVLGERKGYYILITAFCTETEHEKEKKRRQRDRYRKKLTPP